MKSYIEYIEASCAELKDNIMTQAYKKKLIEEMTQRANEITHAGMKDENVVTDIIVNEFGDLVKNYSEFTKSERKRIRSKKFKAIFPISCLIFLVAVLAVYFYVSITSGIWNKSWLILTGGIFLIIEICLGLAINKLCHKGRGFQAFARVLIAIEIMLATVYAFLFSSFIFGDKFTAWPIILIGVIFSLSADLIFAYSTKQKFRTISFFVYMPTIAAILYVILASYSILSWATGWLVILIGVFADLIYLLAMTANNMKYFVYDKEDE